MIKPFPNLLSKRNSNSVTSKNSPQEEENVKSKPLIIFGFILLTLSLISGAPFVIMGEYIGLTEKILFSIIAWITYSYLIFSRFSKGYRGKKATNLTLSGMAFLFISYLGTKLFFEIF